MPSDIHINAHGTKAPDSLQAELDALYKRFVREAPAAVTEAIREAMKQMAESGVAKTCLREGMRPLDFSLPDQHQQMVTLSELLAQGPVVISFFRGGWCPYCSLELKHLQQIEPQIRALGAHLIALSPQTIEQNRETAERLGIGFPLLSDGGNQVASLFGLVFDLPEMLRPIYRNYGIDLPQFNDSDSYELPIAATYVLDETGLIRLAFADTDYTRRLEPGEILSCLESLQAS